MKKKKSLNRKIVRMLTILGLISILITIANISALKVISQLNNSIAVTTKKIDEAAASGNEADIPAAQAELADLIQHSDIRIDGTFKFDIILLVVNALIIVLLYYIVRKTIILPVKKAKDDLDIIIKGIETGKGDLTLRVFDQTGDEIGQLASGINKFIEVLQDLLTKIQRVSKDMSESVYLVREEAESSNSNATNVSATAEELAASMEEVSASLHVLTNSCSEMLDKISEINESANISEVRMNEVKNKAESRYSDAVEAKEKTISTFDGIQQNVVNAVDASKSVNQITELTENILSIAAQTNLLALNASIEAARAGEAGKGFAVVADEIIQLADNSRETANSIQEISGQVIDAVTDLAGNATEMIRFVDDEIVADYDNFVSIIERYEADSEEASTTFSNFAMKSKESVNTMMEMNDGINNISATIEESAQGIANVAEEISQLVMAISSISTQAGENKAISASLSDEVSKFERM